MPLLANLNRVARMLPPSRNKALIGRLITDHLIPAAVPTLTEVPMRTGHRMLLDPRIRNQRGPFWNGEFDEDDVAFYKACILPGDTVFDVGANIGLITIPLACRVAALGSGRVIAIEPVKTNYERLRANITLNGLDDIVTAYNVAVGDREGALDLSVENRRGTQIGNAVSSDLIGDDPGFMRFTCTLTRLDTLAEQEGIDRVDFIKVDIEGAEMLFLNGAEGMISAHRPTVYGEFNAGFMPKFGHTFLDVHRFFKSRGYRTFAFADVLTPHEPEEPGPATGNAFFVAEEKAEALLQRVAAAKAGS